LATVYVADLDAITGSGANLRLYEALAALEITLWLDAGFRDVESLGWLDQSDPSRIKIVVGLETVAGPAQLAAILDVAGRDRVIFSLDLFDGRPLKANPDQWVTSDPETLPTDAIELGVRHVILLDLARVGSERGPGTETLIRRVRLSHPDVRISVGGGVSSIEEVSNLLAQGAQDVLIGSALHKGTIGRKELALLRSFEIGEAPGNHAAGQ
jgi:phosphoribosylformimino-5-aminoimidazole carboxamide ribotide isomerase